MAAAGVTLAVVSLAWAVAFDLTPSDSRPYAGSSHDNSMLELIVVHNGLERFVRAPRTPPAPPPVQAQMPRFEAYDAVPVGPLRLAAPALAAQFAWTLPLAVLGAVFGWRRRRASVALWGSWALTYGIVSTDSHAWTSGLVLSYLAIGVEFTESRAIEDKLSTLARESAGAGRREFDLTIESEFSIPGAHFDRSVVSYFTIHASRLLEL